ncbi:hypothetical protein DTO166G4_5460 [Paecilomyces variotii]|uniref:Uncharacterized protein n=1 Tax=Byssochlamys spectabilis TaxID=264951 RepID=A0A443I7H1_BYSSP|nr:hypothetical protein C8Q69DRAFT_441103 [Paecilomyces variotii]KAJ9212956.1 hypothetical protein DTO166G4_5460 [Paecilomyces variotii]KAJ9223839.1 hypothetical protein DTO169C6_3709 [Paecilomyces variotii]KAJ9236125.1 hypothetical protein DTO166G5_4170 [Paecilomyces variotii]KAJ9254761.1 hypothetical protein DTO195F2_6517 [Paecilomyces variotii]KAJ9286463.1 hypothetical protein DTO021C3_5997 [Paecilomyces variotii]
MASRPSSFFESFQDFVHNPSAPVSAEFTRLAALRKWKVNSKTYRKMWKKCIYSEFEKNYGKEFSRLQCWQNLCSELQIGVFGSIRQCKMALSKVYVNLVDLLDSRATGTVVRTFRTLKQLRTYTRKTGRYFPRDEAKEEGFIKVLLKRIV